MAKKIIATLLLSVICFSFFTQLILPAQASIDTLMPTEEELGYDVVWGDLRYRKYLMEHYRWDTAHRWFVMEGLKPVTGDAEELTSTIITNIGMSINTGLNYVAIFFLQAGFKENLLVGIVGQINDLLRPVKTYFFEQVFWIVSLVLAGLMIWKYAEGKKGEGFSFLLKAVFYSAIIYLLIDQAEWVIINTAGVVNYIALTVLGVVNFSPISGTAAVEMANLRIIEVSNTIFQVYVEDPWTFGQFGVIKNLPMVTLDELTKLMNYGISVTSDITWKEVFLQYPSGGDERRAFIEVLLDDSILHSGNLDTSMFVKGSAARIIITVLAFALNLFGFILFGFIGGIQFASTIGITIITGFLPILMVASFFGHIGEKWLKAAAVIWLYVAALKIAAALYIGIPMMVIRLIPADGLWYMLTVAIHIIVNVVSIIFLPKIFTTMVPAMLRGALKITSAIGNARNRMVDLATGRGRRYRTSPEKMLSEFRRGKFGWGQEKVARDGPARRARRTAQVAVAADAETSKPQRPASPRPRSIDRTPDRKEDHVSFGGHSFKMHNGILLPENPRKSQLSQQINKPKSEEKPDKDKQLENIRQLSGHFIQKGLVDEEHLKHLEELKKELVDTMEDIEQDRQTQRILDKVEHSTEKRENRKRMEVLERKIDGKNNSSDREMMRGPERRF